jgi:signal transduction histidine kinase
MEAGKLDPSAAKTLEEAFEEAELDFYASEVPEAIEQSLEGLERVASIVRAMKEYAHPCNTKEPTNLNQVVQTTTAMSKNEWKYVATLDLQLDQDLPLVQCVAGEISQVLLNLIVNASHAIGEDRDDGCITVRSRPCEDGVEILVSDNGSGIPQHLIDRIFDPFFTTKTVGKGTGQGLALAFDVVVRKHGGRLDVESVPGEGSTFRVFIPLRAREAPAA